MDNPLNGVASRILSLIGVAKILSVKEGATQRLQVDHGPHGPDGSHGLRDNLVGVAPFGLASSPPLEAYAVTAYLGGDRSNGVAFAHHHAPSRPTDLQRGDACLYDNRGRRIWLSEDGIVVNGAAGSVTITNATIVRLECDMLQVTGDIVDNCDDNDKTLKDLRDAYNIHKHTGVTTGGGTSGLTDHLVE